MLVFSFLSHLLSAMIASVSSTFLYLNAGLNIREIKPEMRFIIVYKYFQFITSIFLSCIINSVYVLESPAVSLRSGMANQGEFGCLSNVTFHFFVDDSQCQIFYAYSKRLGLG